MAIVLQESDQTWAMAFEVTGIVQDDAHSPATARCQQAGQMLNADAGFESGFLEVGVKDGEFARCACMTTMAIACP